MHLTITDYSRQNGPGATHQWPRSRRRKGWQPPRARSPCGRSAAPLARPRSRPTAAPARWQARCPGSCAKMQSSQTCLKRRPGAAGQITRAAVLQWTCPPLWVLELPMFFSCLPGAEGRLCGRLCQNTLLLFLVTSLAGMYDLMCIADKLRGRSLQVSRKWGARWHHRTRTGRAGGRERSAPRARAACVP